MNINGGVNTHVFGNIFLQEDPPPNPDTIKVDDHTPMKKSTPTEPHISTTTDHI